MRFSYLLPHRQCSTSVLTRAPGAYAVQFRMLNDTIELVGTAELLGNLARQILSLTDQEGADDGPTE